MTEGFGHVPVLATETLEHLAARPGDRIVDLTLGAGGHSALILEEVGPGGQVIAFDRDPVALAIARHRLADRGERLITVESNFAEAPRHLDELGIDRLDGVLIDLGVSSMQLDDPERGFSFQGDGPLDMRMSPGGETAAELLARASAEELERIFREFGEEPRARAIAARIVDLRRRTRLERTVELAELVRSVYGGKDGRIHPATRVFQALRIALNGELDAVAQVLRPLIERLAPGRRLVAISFHSLEDRIVKQEMRAAEKEGFGRVLTKRPISATEEETRGNPRSRSARLRAFERA
ncbi:MAG: 16S rRNA (cytosine(1402)-N(4))-methyltransferase RsmH [Planctomycetes bacterium]|nr:16S rRNA (cytosine(1402)-N(4))-methyltransferase RsmH [Planctomycetota bacterium]